MTKQIDLPWITEARKFVGLAEIPGKQHNPKIINWLSTLKAWWSDDETPWCGTFVAHCCRKAGRDIPKDWFRALSWRDYGESMDKPAFGCIAVFTRDGGGHVGFVVGCDRHGNIMVLGGNQGNRVSIARFDPARVSAYVWPSEGGKLKIPSRERFNLPYLEAGGALSSNEA